MEREPVLELRRTGPLTEGHPTAPRARRAAPSADAFTAPWTIVGATMSPVRRRSAAKTTPCERRAEHGCRDLRRRGARLAAGARLRDGRQDVPQPEAERVARDRRRPRTLTQRQAEQRAAEHRLLRERRAERDAHQHLVREAAGAPCCGRFDGEPPAQSGVDGRAHDPGRDGSDDATVRVWDVNARKQIGDPFTGHDDAVLGVAWSPDGTRLASTGADINVRLWTVSTENR